MKKISKITFCLLMSAGFGYNLKTMDASNSTSRSVGFVEDSNTYPNGQMKTSFQDIGAFHISNEYYENGVKKKVTTVYKGKDKTTIYEQDESDRTTKSSEIKTSDGSLMKSSTYRFFDDGSYEKITKDIISNADVTEVKKGRDLIYYKNVDRMKHRMSERIQSFDDRGKSLNLKEDVKYLLDDNETLLARLLNIMNKSTRAVLYFDGNENAISEEAFHELTRGRTGF